MKIFQSSHFGRLKPRQPTHHHTQMGGTMSYISQMIRHLVGEADLLVLCLVYIRVGLDED